MTLSLRSAVTGLLSLASVEEQTLLAACGFGPEEARPGYRGGSPDTWAAVPLVAHNNEFKSQQAERIVALRAGQVPPSFGEIDHSSADLYARYSLQSADEVMAGCRRITAELIGWAIPLGRTRWGCTRSSLAWRGTTRRKEALCFTPPAWPSRPPSQAP